MNQWRYSGCNVDHDPILDENQNVFHKMRDTKKRKKKIN